MPISEWDEGDQSEGRRLDIKGQSVQLAVGALRIGVGESRVDVNTSNTTLCCLCLWWCYDAKKLSSLNFSTFPSNLAQLVQNSGWVKVFEETGRTEKGGVNKKNRRWTSCHDDRVSSACVGWCSLFLPARPIRWLSSTRSTNRRRRGYSSNTARKRTTWSRSTSGRWAAWRGRPGPLCISTSSTPRSGGSAMPR